MMRANSVTGVGSRQGSAHDIRSPASETPGRSRRIGQIAASFLFTTHLPRTTLLVPYSSHLHLLCTYNYEVTGESAIVSTPIGLRHLSRHSALNGQVDPVRTRVSGDAAASLSGGCRPDPDHRPAESGCDTARLESHTHWLESCPGAASLRSESGELSQRNRGR